MQNITVGYCQVLCTAYNYMCHTLIIMAVQSFLHQQNHKHVTNMSSYDVTVATVLLGNSLTILQNHITHVVFC